MPTTKLIYQFKITLRETHPPIWRRIQVPSAYRFWDLHVAIQDSMGWSGSHLHKFRIISNAGIMALGIPHREPDDTFSEDVILPDWEHVLSEYEDMLQKAFTNYIYDFDDFWEHMVVFEEAISGEAGVAYPRCTRGKKVCPPEECGGAWGYADLLEVLADPKHKNHLKMKDWLESHTGGPFNPEHFDPAEVVFSDPKERYKECFKKSESSQR